MSTNIRTLRPVLRIGQRTDPSREFTLADSEGKAKPIDLTNAERVTLTMEHYTRAFTAVSDGECEIINPNQGTIEYDFSTAETSVYGRYYVQFEVEWDDGSTDLIPPSGYEWVLDIGRRQPDDSPLEIPRIYADEGVFGELEAEQAHLHALTGLETPAGEYVTDLYGQNLYYENGRLNAFHPNDVGEVLDHMHTGTSGEGGAIGAATDPAAPAHIQSVTLTDPVDETDAPETSTSKGYVDGEVASLDTAKADKDGGGTATLTDYDAFDGREFNGIIYAHKYPTAQEAVDDAADNTVVVFLREFGPYESFTIPPRDGLYLYSPNRAVVETSLATGDTTGSAAIIDGPENHAEHTGSRFTSPTPVTGAVSRGTAEITVGDPAQFSQGDVAFLAAGDEIWRTYSSWSADNLRGEFVTISAVNADTVEIAELGPMIDYANPNGNLSLYKFNAALTNSTIEGFELHGAYEPANHPDDSYSERALVLNGAHDVTLRDIHVQNAGRAGCDLRGCYDVEVNGLSVDTVGRYGLVILEECKAVDATGLTVSRTGRYATQIGAPTSGSYAPTQAIKITGATARDAHLYGYNIHPNGYNITLRSCDGYNVNGGIRVRSEKVTLDGGRFELGSGQMIRGQHRCSGLRVRNVDCNPASQFARFDGTDSVDDIRIEGCSTYGETDVVPSAIMLTNEANVEYGDIRMADCDIPTLRRYQPIIDFGTDVAVSGTITLEGCTFEGAESVAETSTGSSVTGELIVDSCWLSDAGGGFGSFAHTDRVVFLDNRLRNTTITDPGDTLDWSGNHNIST